MPWFSGAPFQGIPGQSQAGGETLGVAGGALLDGRKYMGKLG